MAQTDLLVSKGLKDAGYEYVIGDGTSLPESSYPFTNACWPSRHPGLTNKAILQWNFLWKLWSTSGEQAIALPGTSLGTHLYTHLSHTYA
jgi:hypothetical protein